MSARGDVMPSRDERRILEDLLRQAPGYVPELALTEAGAGRALMQVFARYLELLRGGLREVPKRSQLVFLDMMGTHLLPAQAARVPLVFTLVPGSPADVTVPQGSQVAATPPATPWSIGEPGTRPIAPAEPSIFSTEQAITVARARLASLFSIVPGTDEFADHTTRLTSGFSLFDDLGPTEHAIYLGHDHLFALAGEISVLLAFSFDGEDRGSDRNLVVVWEYLTDSGWLPFENLPEDDTTGGLRYDGQMKLRRACGPDAKKETIEGRTTYWLRGRLTRPLLPLEQALRPSLPVINDISASVSFGKSNLLPEAAFRDASALDLTKDFLPFGPQPARYAVFYLASKEVFQRQRAQVGLDIALSSPGAVPAGTTLQTTWEYNDGTAWKTLNIRSAPAVARFMAPGSVDFDCPADWGESSVSGVVNRWLRVRIVAGDYGRPLRALLDRRIAAISADRLTVTVDTNYGFVGGEIVIVADAAGGVRRRMTVSRSEDTDKLVFTAALAPEVAAAGGTVVNATGAPTLVPSDAAPPVIAKISLRYTYRTDPEPLDHCLTHNDFVFEDQTEACRWPDRVFSPFGLISDRQPAVYFGFDGALPVGLVSIYVDVTATAAQGPGGVSSPFAWEYRSARGWTELVVRDETGGFARSGMVQFVGPPDAVATEGSGGRQFRVRARMKQGEPPAPLPLAGLWLNAVWASDSQTFAQEPLGSSDGNPRQTFTAVRTPVLESESLEVQEWTGRGEYWRAFVRDVAEDDLRFEKDQSSGEVTAVWVRWSLRPHLHASGPADRHYAIERARGLVVFGDGVLGMMPPSGARIALSYRSGGGLGGNVPAGAIAELRTAAPFVLGAANPVPASGGAPTESVASVRLRGPQRLRHRDGAVSPQDCEWIAAEASPEVARARCLPVTGPDGRAQRGWVTVLIVPHSRDDQPRPSVELRRRVAEHLSRRVPASVAGRVRVEGPRYVAVSVSAVLVLLPRQSPAAVEARVRSAIDRFLHPLSGGPSGDGWAFGETVHVSHIASLVENSGGVDFARSIGISIDGRLYTESVPIDADTLLAAGDHELKLVLGAD